MNALKCGYYQWSSRAAGAKAPGEIFEAEELLTALGPDHATFEVVTPLAARKLTGRSTK